MANAHSSERHLSRLIIEVLPDGTERRHSLSVIELHRNERGAVAAYTITPCERETPATLYHDTALLIDSRTMRFQPL